MPHSSPLIPAVVRGGLLLDDAELAEVVAAMTDWLTAPLARAAAAGTGAELWVNPWSRLVVDPERFPDAREPMNAVGLGAVYHRTHDGRPLRTSDGDAWLLERYFTPYGEGLAAAVRPGTVLVDLHSYPSRPLPYEDASRPRPALCIGTDPVHTPPWLVELVRECWTTRVGTDTGVDTPFAGTYVPLDRYGTDPSVLSVMVEIRRDQVHPGLDGPDTSLLSARPWECEPTAMPDERVVAFLAELLRQLETR